MQCIIYFRQFGLECFTSKCHGALIPCIHTHTVLHHTLADGPSGLCSSLALVLDAQTDRSSR